MSLLGWSGPAWGEPSAASRSPVPLRSAVVAADAGYRADGGCTGHLSVLGASVVGVGHRLARRRCEDAFGWVLVTPDVLFLVVADGVSNARRGGDGAEIAVRAACRAALHFAGTAERDGKTSGPAPAGSQGGPDEPFGRSLCLNCLVEANEELRSAAGALGVEPTDLSTTVVMAAVSSRGEEAAVDVACVGDSAAFVLSGQEWLQAAPPGDGVGEEAVGGALRATATPVLPSPAPGEVSGVDLAAVALAAGEVLVLMTDGVAEPLREGPTTVAPAMAKLLARATAGGLSPLGLAEAIDFSRRGCQDDRTLVATWLTPG